MEQYRAMVDRYADVKAQLSYYEKEAERIAGELKSASKEFNIRMMSGNKHTVTFDERSGRETIDKAKLLAIFSRADLEKERILTQGKPTLCINLHKV